VAKKPEGAPCALPDGWRWARLGDVVKEGPTNGWSPQTVEHVTTIKTLKLSATTRGEFDGRYFKYVEAPAETVEKFWLEPEDILIQRSNTPEYVGIAARFDGPRRTFIYPDLMMRCRVTDDVLPAFVHMCLNAPYNRTWFRERASGTSQTMIKLNQASVRSAWIPVPPLPTQRELVASVDGFRSLVDSVTRATNQASATAAQIASALSDPSSWDSPQG
jgi:type I restriction enzyme S subunit